MLNFKSLPFIIGIFIYSLLLSFYINKYFLQVDFLFDVGASLISLSIMVALMILLLTFCGTFFMIVPDRKDRIITILIASLGFIIGYNIYNFNYTAILQSLLLASIFGFGLANYDVSIGIKYRNMIKPSFGNAISDSSGGFLLFFSLIIAMNFYLFNSSLDHKNNIIQQSLNFIIDPVSRALEADSIKIIENLYPELSTSLGIGSRTEPINAELSESIKTSFVKELAPYTTLILNAISVAVFLTLFSVFKLAKIFILPLGLIIFKILESTNYMEKSVETTEIVRYKI